MPASRNPRVTVIGAGNVGSSLAIALHKEGYPIVSVISRTVRSALALAKSVSCQKASTSVADISPDSELILIATPDRVVEDIAGQIARLKKLKFRKLFAAHTAGVLSADALEPLRRKGALIASIHPIQSFPSVARLKGVYFGIGAEGRALTRAEQLVKSLGGSPVAISEQMKPLYHAACVFASAYMVVFLNSISELARHLDLKASWTEVFGPLMTSAMENAVKHSPERALTGPIIRGDFTTINLHLSALSKYTPQLLPLYTIGGIEAARIAKEQGRIGKQDYDEIVSRFRKFIRTTSIKKNQKVNH